MSKEKNMFSGSDSTDGAATEQEEGGKGNSGFNAERGRARNYWEKNVLTRDAETISAKAEGAPLLVFEDDAEICNDPNDPLDMERGADWIFLWLRDVFFRFLRPRNLIWFFGWN